MGNGHGPCERRGRQLDVVCSKGGRHDVWWGFPAKSQVPIGKVLADTKQKQAKPREIRRNQDFPPSGRRPTGGFCQEEYELQEGFAKNEGDADPGQR